MHLHRPCLAQRTSAWTTVGRGARRSTDTPTSHHARSQSKSSPPFQRARQPARPAADSLQQLSRPPLSPGPLWFLLPATFVDSCRGSQAPVAFSSTASPGVSVNSTPTTGSSTKRSMAVALSRLIWPVLPSLRPPHRMTISLLAMPSIHAMQQPI
jgi:hypothetical protein